MKKFLKKYIKSKAIGLGVVIGLILGAAVLAYAVANLFFTQSETSNFSKKTVFQFDLTTGLQAAEIGPGDSFSVSPVVYNDATENMYVFIVVSQQIFNDESIYTYTASDSWKLISSSAEKQVYAYAGDEMTVLMPGETTDVLMDKMTMKSISNADYSLIDDINVTITGYAIGTEDASTDPEVAWASCKLLGNIE